MKLFLKVEILKKNPYDNFMKNHDIPRGVSGEISGSTLEDILLRKSTPIFSHEAVYSKREFRRKF